MNEYKQGTASGFDWARAAAVDPVKTTEKHRYREDRSDPVIPEHLNILATRLPWVKK